MDTAERSHQTVVAGVRLSTDQNSSIFSGSGGFERSSPDLGAVFTLLRGRELVERITGHVQVLLVVTNRSYLDQLYAWIKEYDTGSVAFQLRLARVTARRELKVLCEVVRDEEGDAYLRFPVPNSVVTVRRVPPVVP